MNMKHVLCLFLLFVAIPLFFFKAMAQKDQVLTLEDSLKVQRKASVAVVNFLRSHSLASLRDSKQLKSAENETICFPPKKYYDHITAPRLDGGSSAGRKLGFLAAATVATSLGTNSSQPKYDDGEFTLDVSDNSSWDASVSDNNNWGDSITMVVKKVKSRKLVCS